MYNYNYTRFNLSGSTESLVLSVHFHFGQSARSRLSSHSTDRQSRFIAQGYISYYGRGGQMDVNECAGYEIGSGLPEGYPSRCR